MALSSDIARAVQSNPNIGFVVPADGTWISLDCIVAFAPNDAHQKEIGEDFINFLLLPSGAAEIANYSFKANTDRRERAFLEPAIKFDPAYQSTTYGLSPLRMSNQDQFQQQIFHQIPPEIATEPSSSD